MGAHDRGIEHLDQMRRWAHRRQRIEKGFEHTGLAQPVEPLPDSVPVAVFLRKRAPAHVLHREEMHRLQKPPIIRRLAATARQTRPEYQQRVLPIFLAHPCRQCSDPFVQSESYESEQIHLGNREFSIQPNSSTRPSTTSIAPLGAPPALAPSTLLGASE